MPKDTFFNLPEAKRQHLVEIALEEFALNDYKTASISRIVEKAGIAKGSIYQYFDDKKELYAYLIQLASETKFAYFSSQTDFRETDFFENYKHTVLRGARFDFTQPCFAGILFHATHETNEPEILDISVSLRNASLDYVRGLVTEAVREGQIRSDISIDFIAYALNKLTLELIDYVSTKYQFSFKEAISRGTGAPISDAALTEVLDEFITFFREGLCPPGN